MGVDASLALLPICIGKIISVWLLSFEIIVKWGDWFELPDESLNDEVVVVTSFFCKRKKNN